MINTYWQGEATNVKYPPSMAGNQYSGLSFTGEGLLCH